MNFTFNPKIKKERLAGITNFVYKNSIASVGSAGSQLVSTEQEIRSANRAIYIIPELSGVVKIETLLNSIISTGVIVAGTNNAGEIAVDLQEYATKPFNYRPRDYEQTTTESLLARYQGGFQISAVASRDKNYLGSIYKQIVAGANGGAKGKIVNVATADMTSSDQTKLDNIAYQFRKEVMEICNIKDRHGRGITRQSLVCFASPAFVLAMKQSTIKGLYNEAIVSTSFSNGKIIDGVLDGVRVLETNELDTPLASGKNGVWYVIMLVGSAVSPFLFKDMLNFDKSIGVNNYVCSLEFNAATAVLLPNYISICLDSTTSGIAAQARVSIDTVDLSAVEASSLSVDRAHTDTTNPVNPFDATKANDGKGK